VVVRPTFGARGGALRVGVLWLEAEAREGTAGAASERDKKHGAREKFWPAVGGSTLLKGGGATGHNRGGCEKSSDAWKGGPGSHRQGQLGRCGTAGSGPTAARVSTQRRAVPGH
jgi:hypothetical protein